MGEKILNKEPKLDINKETRPYDAKIYDIIQLKDFDSVNNILMIELPVLQEWNDSDGTTHRGALATIIDAVTFIAAFITNKSIYVSLDLSIHYISPLKNADTMQIEVKSYNTGKPLAYALIKVRANNVLIAVGRQTIFKTQNFLEKL